MSELGSAFVAQPQRVFERLRERGSVCPVTTPAGGTVWVVTRDADVRSGLRDPRLTLGGSDLPETCRALDVSLMNYDPPRLTQIRALATQAFTPKRISGYNTALAAIARDVLEAIPGARVVDLMSTFSRPFAFRALCEVFGIPMDARDELYGWLRVVFDGKAHGHDTLGTTVDRLDEFVAEELDRRISRPGDDLWSAIATAWTAQREVTRRELLSLCGMLLLAGFDTTAQAIGIGAISVLTNRSLRTLTTTDASRVVDEVLRWDTPSPFATKRTARAEISLGGQVIPAGAGVLLSIAAANHDPGRYPHPERLDADRPDRGQHLAFGLGPHRCLGATLANLELAVAITTLVRQRPRAALAVPPQALRWLGNFYHRRLAELPVTGMRP
jgi:cytochrome P450